MSWTKRNLKLRRLTDEQEALLPVVRDEWLGIGLSTEPADRAEAERGVALAYRCAGLPAPDVTVWLQSPLSGAVGSSILAIPPGDQVRTQVWDQVRTQVWDQVWTQVWAQVRAQVGAQVGTQAWAQVRAQVWDQVWDQVRAQVGDQVGDQVWDQVRAQVRTQVWDQVRAQVRAQVGDQVSGAQVSGAQVGDQVWRCCYGMHEAGWFVWIDFFGRCGINTARVSGMMAVARSAGWWWPFNGAAILTERPCRLRRDSEHRLHSGDGRAIEYPDGWGVYAWHGVRVPEQVIMTPEALTPHQISTERNAEVRRVMVERFGAQRYVREIGADIIDIGHVPCSNAEFCKHTPEHHTVRLYRAELGEDEPLVMVEVTNSTPEPDGEWKRYMLRVPPRVQTAREAVAWTFGTTADDYAPSMQT
jgi:hypothetical protein